MAPMAPSLPAIQVRPEVNESDQIVLFIDNIQPGTTLHDMISNLERQGNIVYIEIFADKSQRGKVTFSPAPSPFWRSGQYPITTAVGNTYNVKLRLDTTPRRERTVKSPFRRNAFYPEKTKLVSSTLQFGIMIEPECMMPMETLESQEPGDLTLTVNLRRKELEAHFTVHLVDPRIQGDIDFPSTSEIGEYNRREKYLFTIPFGQLKSIQKVDLTRGNFSLLISLDSPPRFFRWRNDGQVPQSGALSWNQWDGWFRQTDIEFDPFIIEHRPIALHKKRPVIDIGRWTTYRWTFNNSQCSPDQFQMVQAALQDFNIDMVPLNSFSLTPMRKAELWSLIDPSEDKTTKSGLRSLDPDSIKVHLTFEVRYQLEVCISRGIVNEYNIDKNFINSLAELSAQDSAKARNLLEYVAEHYSSKRLYDPSSIFTNSEALSFSSLTDIPHYCAFSRKATVTPTSILFNSPTVETTNRVLRHYSKENEEGRFLRVQFTDEKFEGRINSCADKIRNDAIFTRVFRVISNGVRIGDRHYEFLAFGNSQFRENGAYFFCPPPYLSCNDIRQWMGTFSHINVVAKYAARLGQCFSTTRAIKGLSAPDIVKIPDIERGMYCFTDGVGKISPYLAQMIAAELKLRVSSAPSAFQFRLGGCKGILVVSPDAKNNEVHIRKSQQKFTAAYNGLEIIRCSQFSSATLNRQTITILSALGVKDEVFLKMLSRQLSDYQSAMDNNTIALGLLNRYIDDNHMTINIAGMILNGFMSEKEPFVLSLLHLWRAWSIKLLKEKAKIIVENGAFVLGCVDETNTLRGYTKPTVACGTTYKETELPQIFIQVPHRENTTQYNVIEGICLVGRNPSLHPGDLRVVQAVNVPALHHLRDVVVFPQSGERDVPSMCSGGDLDGDDFFVIWDKDLQPTEWNCEPMSYAALDPITLKRPVVVTDLQKFFVKYMKNDSLPSIAHAHLAQADYQKQGIKDAKCLELAELHSKAVDYVKTGQPATMRKELAPPKWPHFMEKIHQPASKQYHSQKILGQLYDKVESVDFVPQYEEPFDKRILRAYKLDSAILKAARQTKTKYDTAMRRILAQQDIKTEFEVWSTFILSKPKVGSDYKLQEDMAVITGALKDRFRTVCINVAGGKDFSILGPFVAAMYKVTKEELDIALAECRSTRTVNGITLKRRRMRPESMPLISFPWLFEKELGRIATGIEAIDDFEKIGFSTFSIEKPQVTALNHQPQRSKQDEDFVKQENGLIVHRGEILDVFPENSDNDFPWDSDAMSDTSLPDFVASGQPMSRDGVESTTVEASSEGTNQTSTLQDNVLPQNLQSQNQVSKNTEHEELDITTEFIDQEILTPSSSVQSSSPEAPVTTTKSDISLSDDEETEEHVEIIESVVRERSMIDRLSAFVD
ncbi:uncharacterized protein EAE97_007711 [Botrytis byssoidea]|uniref:RNA-dependent RNA polymerase n=1 Tax=Botrytis byssoidea TaxID=139641 RepID=A0A9P5IJK2_9HELO|nr:uncharacterized protein EAE97_007711 [Botrytis byssoidea]KAF7937915.1 hypothetical protein EAE97_007711 [Botrytis byssoidea]